MIADQGPSLQIYETHVIIWCYLMRFQYTQYTSRPQPLEEIISENTWLLNKDPKLRLDADGQMWWKRMRSGVRRSILRREDFFFRFFCLWISRKMWLFEGECETYVVSHNSQRVKCFQLLRMRLSTPLLRLWWAIWVLTYLLYFIAVSGECNATLRSKLPTARNSFGGWNML